MYGGGTPPSGDGASSHQSEMQMRLKGIEVNETPKCFVKNPTNESFAACIELDVGVHSI